VVIVFGDRAHRHRPDFDSGAGVVDIVRGLHAEEVALVSLTHEVDLGLGGIRQSGGPGAVLHVVVAQGGCFLPAPSGGQDRQRTQRISGSKNGK
jgi:hypothetical protein